MSAMEWKIAQKVSDDLTKQLLYNRGLKTQKEIEQFFNPVLSNFTDDIKLSNIAKAQKRIKQSIDRQELIFVYGDYDVDGVSASAIIYKALTSVGAKVLPYIPHREKEGYGMSSAGLDFARDLGAGLVITVDNGIVATKEAEYANKLGLDLIITDHHTPSDRKPGAFAIVHTQSICGAGVAWCLVQDIIEKDLSRELLQFVAIATICDLLPLLGINRAFVTEGLEVLNKTKNIGLLSLIADSRLVLGKISSYEIGYVLGPRLNAIGRLEHAIDALRLLCTKDSLKAHNLSNLLSETNSRRQFLTDQAVTEARIMISQSPDKKIHILESNKWPSGIIGLIASKISQEYYRPTIAISLGEKLSKGSARSINGLNITEVIRQCQDILVSVGGHAGAAGFSILNEKIDIFKQRLQNLTSDLFVNNQKVLEIEAEIEKTELTPALVYDLEKFAPFGFGNPRPRFMTRSVSVTDIRTVGNGHHLKFKASGIDAIAFGMGQEASLLSNQKLVDLAYIFDINTFNGISTPQLKVEDITIHD